MPQKKSNESPKPTGGRYPELGSDWDDPRSTGGQVPRVQVEECPTVGHRDAQWCPPQRRSR